MAMDAGRAGANHDHWLRYAKRRWSGWLLLRAYEEFQIAKIVIYHQCRLTNSQRGIASLKWQS